jgi:hypothetical protein
MSAQPATANPSARTIDEVIKQLDEIITMSRSENSRLGYFAVLYRNVTIEVKRGIAQGRFENGPRMEQLDVTFANRYLTALRCYRRGEQASKCWVAAFRAATVWPPIVLQHLLMGMNAHINLDLGAAAAIVCPGDQLPSLKHDFDEINNILEAMIGGVRLQLSKISHWMKLLDIVGARTQKAIVNWSIDKARDAAWRVAERLAPLSPEQMEVELDRLDDEIDLLAALIRYPGLLISAAIFFVRLSEPRSVSKILDMLD